MRNVLNVMFTFLKETLNAFATVYLWFFLGVLLTKLFLVMGINTILAIIIAISVCLGIKRTWEFYKVSAILRAYNDARKVVYSPNVTS